MNKKLLIAFFLLLAAAATGCGKPEAKAVRIFDFIEAQDKGFFTENFYAGAVSHLSLQYAGSATASGFLDDAKKIKEVYDALKAVEVHPLSEEDREREAREEAEEVEAQAKEAYTLDFTLSGGTKYTFIFKDGCLEFEDKAYSLNGFRALESHLLRMVEGSL